MFPTILELGPITISALGVMTALGFFLGSFLIWQKGREEHFEEALLMDGILLIGLVGLVSARIWYVVFNWSKFERAFSFFDLAAKPGFSWHGALLGGILTLIIYCQKKKWDFFKLADISVFGFTLGIIFNRFGLFSLIEAGLLLLAYRLLFIFEKNYRAYEWYKDKRGEAKPGFLFSSFLGLTSLIHLIADVFKSSLTPSFKIYQLVDVLLILSALALLYFRSGKGKDLTIPMPSFKKKRGVKKTFRIKAGMEVKK